MIDMNTSENKTCPKCGVTNNTIAKFCENCGFTFEEIKSQDNAIKESPEYEVTERKRLRVYSMLALTIFFAIFFITLGALLPEYFGIFIAVGFIVLCPLGALSTNGYLNDLRKKFIISIEEIKLQKTHSLIKIRWGEFDILRVKIKGEFSVDFPSISAISRDYTKFRILCIDKIHNRTVQTFNFKFYNRKKAREVLDLLVKFAEIMNKELILKKKHTH